VRRFVRLIALIVSLSATGPSGALALCVAACPLETSASPAGARGNACHENDQDRTSTIGRGGMGCPHSPAATLGAGELAREERFNPSFVTPTAGVPQLVDSPRIAAVIQFGSSLTSRSARLPLVLRI
jgi:hypothetical protein